MFYALIVGNDVYEAKEFADLGGAVRDAEKLAKFFEEKLPTVGGYDAAEVRVTLLKNPTSEQVRKEFDAIVRLLDRNSVFVFYFAGHGLCLPGMNRPSLLCRDAMRSLLYGATSAGEISPQFITATSRDGFGDMLFLFDACRNDVFTGRGESPRQKGMKELCRDAVSRKNRDRNSGNRCTLSSCSDGERASDDGAFLDAILAEWDASLESGDGLAVGWEFTARVSQRLWDARCRQRPEFEGVSFALTPGGKKDRFSLGRALRAILAPAATGVAVGLVLLAAILFFPKVASLLYKPETTPAQKPSVVETPKETPNEEPDASASSEVASVPSSGPNATPTPPPGYDDPSELADPETALNEGLTAFDAKDYRTALAKATAVLKAEPENPGAKDLEDRAKKGLSSQLAEKGRSELDSSKPLDALKTAVEASTYDSSNAAAVKLRTDAKNRALDDAKRTLEIGEYSEAKRLAQAVLDVVKTDGYATIILNDAQKGLDKRNRVATLLTESRNLLSEDKASEALKKVEEALDLDPSNSAANALKGEIEKKLEDKQVAQWLSEGWSALGKDDFDGAADKADAVLRLRPNDSEALKLQTQTEQKREDAQVAKLLQEGRDALKKGDYALAASKAEEAKKLRPNNPDVKRLASDAKALEEKKQKEARETVAAPSSGKTSSGGSTPGSANRPSGSATAWAESSTRKAGTRQILKVGDKEYVFVWIPAGEFDMGSPESEEGRFDDETLHHVKLTKGFWMLETETTQALYKEVMGKNPSSKKGDNLPVEMVSWNDATKFCSELTKRLPAGLTASLPTEAQWEYACRAGTTTAYWYGNSADSSKMNYYSSGTKAVKSYAPNPWGLYDMHGNVWEWCLDYFGDYPTGSAIDPKGPNSASHRAFRGGSWYNYARYCRSANRNWFDAGLRFDYLGFRVLLSCD